MRPLVSLIAGLVLVAAAPVVAADAAPGTGLARGTVASRQPARAEFGAGPASATKLDGRPYFAYDATPGGITEDHIAVINFADRPQTLNVYPVDAASGTNGGFSYQPKSAPRALVGAWLTVLGANSAGQVTVPARTTKILAFELRVPRNASSGDHVGAVIVSLTGLAKAKGRSQLVKFEQRLATEVIIRVSGPLHPQLTIENLHASYSGSLDPFASGVVSVTYTVSNTGNVLLGGSQHVSAHGLFGSSGQAPRLAPVPLLLPGGSYRVTTRVPGVLPEISVTTTVRLDPAGLRGDINPGLHVISASVTLWVVSWLLVVIVIILLLVVIALIWRRRRRRPSSPSGRADVSQTPQGVKS
jgi:Bacterial protein of unknown function (DUF916)